MVDVIQALECLAGIIIDVIQTIASYTKKWFWLQLDKSEAFSVVHQWFKTLIWFVVKPSIMAIL